MGKYGRSKRQRKFIYESVIGLRSSEQRTDLETGGIAKESQRQKIWSQEARNIGNTKERA